MQTQNGVLTDGGESRAPIYTESSFTLPIESVSEFRVDTATYPAEYGRAAGGVVNMVTKSGTNQFHGVVYEFLRNDHLNANSWQNNRTGVNRNLFQRNEYGAAVRRSDHSRSYFLLPELRSPTPGNTYRFRLYSADRRAARRRFLADAGQLGPARHDLRSDNHAARSQQSRQVYSRSIPWQPHSRRIESIPVSKNVTELLAGSQSDRRRSDALQ